MINSKAYRFASGRLLILARAPVAGSVKTRLAAVIGAGPAAEVHSELLRRTLDVALRARLARLDLHVTEPGHPLFETLAAAGTLRVCRQQLGDLGARMHGALCDALTDSEFAVLIGSDCPVMTGRYLAHACAQLQAGTEVVVGPAEDGGYVLIGMRACRQALFEAIPWGGAGVLQATRSRARALRLSYAELDVLWDVDTPADLQRWRAQADSEALSGQRLASAQNPDQRSG
jgi:rSAM/selenodomain-associated transferase 1